MANEMIEHIDGMAIGKGFDSLTGDVKVSFAVEGKVGSPPGASGQSGSSLFMRIEETEQFDKALNIDVEAGYKGLAVRASAKFKFKEQCKVNKQSTFCLARFDVFDAHVSYVTQPKFTKEAEELLRLGKSERFRERFGDRFCAGHTKGGEFFGSVRIEHESKEKEREIAASISAAYGLFSASAKVDHSLTESFSKESIEIFVLQSGGTVGLIPTVDDLFQKARDVSNEIRNGGGLIYMDSLEDYRQLKHFGDDTSEVQVRHAKEVLKACMRDYNALLEESNDIDFWLRRQDWFRNVDVPALNQANKLLASEMNKIMKHADEAARHPENAEFYEPTRPDFERPIRKNRKIHAVKSYPIKVIQAALGIAQHNKDQNGIAFWQAHLAAAMAREKKQPKKGSAQRMKRMKNKRKLAKA